MAIASISDGEDGDDVRTKLNAVITKTNFLQPRASKVWAPFGLQVAAGGALVANTIALLPFMVYETMTITDFVCRITTSAAGGNIQLAVYASDPTTRMPTGTALGSTASQVTDASGTFTLAVTDFQMTPGLYWYAVNADNSTVAMGSISTALEWTGALIGATLAATAWSGTSAINFYFNVTSQNFNTWPDLTSATFNEQTNNKAAAFKFLIASVP